MDPIENQAHQRVLALMARGLADQATLAEYLKK
jgi:hypothetical protein